MSQIDLLGFSFGSRIALEVVRRHPTRVRRMVLQGVLGVDTLRAPSLDDRVFTLFAGIAEAQAGRRDSCPAWRKRSGRPAAGGSGADPDHDPDRERRDAAACARPRQHQCRDPRAPWRSSLSAVLTAATSEDYSLLVPWVQGLYQDLEKGAGSLMARVMLCSAASEGSSRRQAAREAPAALLGEALDNRMQDAAFCQAFGITPPSSQPAVEARVPTLLISGTHDPRTPPDRAEVTRRGLAGSEHVIVENGGHGCCRFARCRTSSSRSSTASRSASRSCCRPPRSGPSSATSAAAAPVADARPRSRVGSTRRAARARIDAAGADRRHGARR